MAKFAPGRTLSGTVSDEDGNAVHGAVVSDGDRTAVTDENGNYRLVEGSPGTYEFHASHP